MEALEEVNIGEKNIKRNFWSPAFFYRYEAVIYYLGYPERVRQRYSWKVSLLFSMLAGLGVGVALFLVKKFEKSDAWDVLWNFKKVLYYMGFLVVAPASIVYFVYAAAKLNKEYRKALGFVAPVRKNILYSAVIGVIFFLVWKAAEFVMAVNGIPYVGFDFPKVGLDYVDTLIWSWGVLLIFCLPFVEEILLSGYFYPIIKEKKGINYGIGVTALLFTFFHLVFALFKLQIALIPFFYIFSGIKMYSYERTHCIYVPLIIYNLYYIAAALLFITI